MPLAMNGFEGMEELKQSLYDTVKLDKAALFVSSKFFDIPVSGLKTFADTNMVCSRMLPHLQCFIIRRIRMEVLGGTAGDLAWLQRCCSLQLVIGTKIYWQGAASTLLLENWLRRGLKDIGRTKRRKVEQYLDRSLRNGFLHLGGTTPIVIEQKQDFLVEVFCTPYLFPSQKISIRVFLDGTLFRPIQ